MAGRVDAERLLHGLHFVRGGGCIDQHRLGQARTRERERLLDDRLAARRRERIDAKAWATRAPFGDLRVGRLRRAAGEHRRIAVDARQRGRVVALGQQARGAEIRRQAERDARAAGDERQVRAGLAEHVEIAVGQRVGDREARAFRAQLRDRRAHCCGAEADRVVADQADPRRRLALQHAHEVRVLHRRERMVLHPRFVQQRIADEQVAAKDRAAVLRECRARDREAAARRVEQRVGNRADVACVGGVERRAILEEELAAALRAQPFVCGERLRDRVGRGNRARLQRDDDRVGVERGAIGRHADRLHGAHAALDEHVREIGRAGEIVGDAAEQGTGSGHDDGLVQINGKAAA